MRTSVYALILGNITEGAQNYDDPTHSGNVS